MSNDEQLTEKNAGSTLTVSKDGVEDVGNRPHNDDTAGEVDVGSSEHGQLLLPVVQGPPSDANPLRPPTQVETSSSPDDRTESDALAQEAGAFPVHEENGRSSTAESQETQSRNSDKPSRKENSELMPSSPPQQNRKTFYNDLALSPSRSSLMSSIASSSTSLNGEDPERDGGHDTNDDSEEDDGAARLTIDPAMLMLGGAYSPPGKTRPEMAWSTSMDDKSLRSVESRPDPPSVLDGKDQDDELIDTVAVDQFAAVSLFTNTDPPLALNGQEHASPMTAEPLPSTPSGSNLEGLSPENVAAHASLSTGRLEDQNGKPPEESTSTSVESLPVEPEFAPDEPALLQPSLVGPDNLMILPRVDENRFYISPALQPRQILQAAHQQLNGPPSMDGPVSHNSQAIVSAIHQAPLPGLGLLQQVGGLGSLGGGRRKIRLRLQEEVKNTVGTIRKHFRTTSLLGSLKRNSSRVLRLGGSSRSIDFDNDLMESPVQTLYRTVDRGTITISWYDGTSSLELQQHVRKTILRKLKLETTNVELDDVRILDESADPPEEIVLSPYIPDGSQFLLRFNTISQNDKLKTHTDGTETPRSEWSGRPPLSPSAAPSPHPEKDLLSNLNANQLALLKSMKMPSEKTKYDERKLKRKAAAAKKESQASDSLEAESNPDTMIHPLLKRDEAPVVSADEDLTDVGDEDEDDMMLHSEDPIEARLRQITEILLADREKADGKGRERRREEKRQVIFVVANYFVLFLAIIAISAELQMRAPNWLKMMEDHLQSVQNCGGSQEALYECVSRGDFAGLIASLILWLSRSVATRRFFLFGFDTPKKLWTVVYESLVTSLCWGISYIFIRRGMNPDTRPRFVQKYWKDAVYGSLAGFNAAFLKHVLKNLIPQEVVEDAIRERHLKVLGWLPSFFA